MKDKGTANFFLLRLVPCICIVSSSNVAFAQRAQPLPVNDALNVHFLGESSPIRFSPDGKRLAYVARDNRKVKAVPFEMARTGVGWSEIGTDIYVVDVKSGEATNLTEGKGDNWLPTWSPDGHYLAFLSNRDGSSQAKLWLWNKANELRRVSEINVRADTIKWTPDGRKLLITTLPEGLAPDGYAKRILSRTAEIHAPIVSRQEGSTVRLYESKGIVQGEKEAQASDPWSLDESLRDLASVDVASGKTEMLVRGQRIGWYLPSPDGSRIIYAVPTHFEKPGSQQILYDLVAIRPSTKVTRVVASGIRLVLADELRWSPDSSRLVYRTFGMEEKTYDCYTVAVDGGTPQNISLLITPHKPPAYLSLAPLWDVNAEYVYFLNSGALWRSSLKPGKAVEVARIPGRDIVQTIPQRDNLLWTPDHGKSTVVLTHDDSGKQDGFYRVDLTTGRSTKLLENGRCYTCSGSDQFTAIAANGQSVAFYVEDAQHAPDVWISDASFASPRRLTHLNPQFERTRMGEARLIEWLSDNGEPLHGALLLPSDYRQGVRYPLIVWVYGGSSLSDNLDHFGSAYRGPFNMQLLATRDYAVLLPDAPQHLGTPMLDLAKTVLPGVSKVVEMGIADPDRLGVMGHSYGGYSTLSLIVQTNRFKVAIEVSGMGDILGEYGTMDKSGAAFGVQAAETSQELMGGTPWQYRDRYIENSPIFYLDHVETPLLIIHGSDDTSPPAFLADQVFVGLRRLGKEVEYAKYEGEEHDPTVWSYPNQMDYCNRMIAWFGKYLKREVSQADPASLKP